MPVQRLVNRLAVAAATVVTLVGTSGGLAQAQPGHLPHDGHPDPTTARCKAERADVKQAKKDAEHAHRTGKPAKVEKAEDELAQQRRQASRWCSAAKSEAAATARADAALAAWAALTTDPAVTSLPADLQAALATVAAGATAEIQALEPQIAGASSRDLAHLVNRLRALDPTSLQDALGELSTALAAYDGDPTDLLSGVVDALAGFDATARHPHLQAVVGAVRAAAEAVAGTTDPTT